MGARVQPNYTGENRSDPAPIVKGSMQNIKIIDNYTAADRPNSTPVIYSWQLSPQSSVSAERRLEPSDSIMLDKPQVEPAK